MEITTISQPVDSGLLFIQNIYKSLIERPADSADLKLMDRLDLVLSVMSSAGVEKVVGFNLLHLIPDTMMFILDRRMGLQNSRRRESWYHPRLLG